MKRMQCLILILFLYYVNCRLTTEYYKNLITKSTSKAQHYELPQNNAEFKNGFESTETKDFGSFDFIIVGAGSAGSILATRLSEIRDWSILLLEAGGEENDFTKIPDMFMYLLFTELNWGYSSTPQKHGCLGMKEKKCLVPRGKALGGCSAINAMLYTRGNKKDFDKWAELGNPGWSYNDVLPYFIKSENSQIDGDEHYHGTGGLLNVEYALPPADLYETFINASAELNIPELDFNGKEQFGISRNHLTIKRGKRQSTSTAFLNNARKRKNLRIVTKALVTKIDIDKDRKVAKGVEFVIGNKKYSAAAEIEVILSGGSINSPQLLMLSGIGPKKHLEELGIQVIADLPVGENLQEHMRFPGLVFHTNYTPPRNDVEKLVEQYLEGLGPLTNPSNMDVIGFIKTKTNQDFPMIEFLFFPPGTLATPIIPRLVNYDHELDEYLKKLDPDSDIGLNLLLLHPKSKGRVTLQSKNPIDFPNIDLNVFSEQEDVDNIIEGIEFFLQLTNTEAFKKLNATLVDIPICGNFEKHSKQFWECAIRHMSLTLFHPTGTTSMGQNPETSVVDHNLKVHGIQKLRVVDAGVFPSTISGHPHAAVIMAAEKISDAVKTEYGANFHFGTRHRMQQCDDF